MLRNLLTVALSFLVWCCSSGKKEGVDEMTRSAPDSGKTSDSGRASSKIEAREQGESNPGNVEDTLMSTYEFKDFSTYSLADTIIGDLNGDRVNDTATFETRNGKAGIVIREGGTSRQTLIGCGHAFEEMGDDFSWVEQWGILRDKSTYEIVIKDAEIIGGEQFMLDNPSVYVRKAEVGGGVITFKDGRFTWVHQAD